MLDFIVQKLDIRVEMLDSLGQELDIRFGLGSGYDSSGAEY